MTVGSTQARPRIDVHRLPPRALGVLSELQRYVDDCNLEPPLLELVKLRASQLNGCAFCVDMHARDARTAGETEQRLHGLVAWRDAPFYSDRERAALAWTEAVTLLASTADASGEHAADGAYAAAGRHFDERELVDLTIAVVAINGWNRLAIGFRWLPDVDVTPEEPAVAGARTAD